MRYWIKTWWIWLKRAGKTRGFGVQSPSAYSFIRYVINEHYPYYAYAELKDRLDMLSRLEHKLGRLLFRLANFWQPDVRYTDETQYLPYMYAGCHRSDVKSLSEFVHPLSSSLSRNEKNMVVVDLKNVSVKEVKNAILPVCGEQTLLVCLGLHTLPGSYQGWKELRESPLVGITYDLYYAGIVFFDKSKFKQHYDVNF